MTLLDLTGVSFAYGGGKTVLQGIDLSIRAGNNLGIVGESGSGKTTLLKLLLGLERVSAGTVSFRGQSLDTGNRSFMRGFRRSVQAVFQDPYSSLDPRQRVFDIIAEPLRSLKIETDIANAVAEALQDVDLPADAAGRYPHEFSGGQRQRIAIARAIVAKPDLIIADEVVSALDLSTRTRIIDLMRTLASRMTFIVVSHDIALVALLCEQLVVLEKGLIVEKGATRDLLSRPAHPYTQKLLASMPRMPVTG
ncbi:peptide ABC transporter ATP-binding protein [Rhizobium sp. Root73]|uniref:ABC transporter ATP-binding protein n=1 Tax=unclassified Rhizobium TaxID=2613769 RepID=UPI000723FF72|nr:MULTISPECIES: ATP-binding cassette domain-containing protein [unclassified Rhizobium]KQY16352.1 peptide ABC transporter ATP-binding protein [Rhizobium sp. Root1334]KRC12729.1 peptide ABC transporter ATP-binding protein [Rhizobium sp. Root73]